MCVVCESCGVLVCVVGWLVGCDIVRVYVCPVVHGSFVHVFVCADVCMSGCLCVFVCVCLFVCLCGCWCVGRLFCWAVGVLVCLCVGLWVGWFDGVGCVCVCARVCVAVWLCLCVCVCVCLCVCVVCLFVGVLGVGLVWLCECGWLVGWLVG